MFDVFFPALLVVSVISWWIYRGFSSVRKKSFGLLVEGALNPASLIMSSIGGISMTDCVYVLQIPGLAGIWQILASVGLYVLIFWGCDLVVFWAIVSWRVNNLQEMLSTPCDYGKGRKMYEEYIKLLALRYKESPQLAEAEKDFRATFDINPWVSLYD